MHHLRLGTLVRVSFVLVCLLTLFGAVHISVEMWATSRRARESSQVQALAHDVAELQRLLEVSPADVLDAVQDLRAAVATQTVACALPCPDGTLVVDDP